ncbi:unnamed protein product [Mesocestoides corti]|uniref:Uncharacterized protein n=2 Tax=Mesocestoides corti TaxID=53468 RepID=A0A0R3UCZ0_MESCO|nr:unnamed protein product [Mesocestoides corti]
MLLVLLKEEEEEEEVWSGVLKVLLGGLLASMRVHSLTPPPTLNARLTFPASLPNCILFNSTTSKHSGAALCHAHTHLPNPRCRVPCQALTHTHTPPAFTPSMSCSSDAVPHNRRLRRRRSPSTTSPNNNTNNTTNTATTVTASAAAVAENSLSLILLLTKCCAQLQIEQDGLGRARRGDAILGECARNINTLPDCVERSHDIGTSPRLLRRISPRSTNALPPNLSPSLSSSRLSPSPTTTDFTSTHSIP